MGPEVLPRMLKNLCERHRAGVEAIGELAAADPAAHPGKKVDITIMALGVAGGIAVAHALSARGCGAALERLDADAAFNNKVCA